MIPLLGCNFERLEHDPKSVFEDSTAYRVSEEIIDIIRAKDIEGFIARAHPDAESQANIVEQMKTFYSYLPLEDDFEIHHYYSELRQGAGEYAGVPIYLTAYDVVGKNSFAQMMIAVAPHEGKCCVTTSWQVKPTDVRPSTMHDLTFEGRSLLHYVFFGLFVFIPIFMLFTAIMCARHKNMKRRWLLILFIVFGFWGFEMNWTTGELFNQFIQMSANGFQIKIFKFQLLGIAIERMSIFQPWILSIGTPIGAILYWLYPHRGKALSD